MATVQCVVGWENTTWLSNDPDSSLDLVKVLSHRNLLVKSFLRLHTNLRVVAAARGLRLEHHS